VSTLYSLPENNFHLALFLDVPPGQAECVSELEHLIAGQAGQPLLDRRLLGAGAAVVAGTAVAHTAHPVQVQSARSVIGVLFGPQCCDAGAA
jgi:hypothetical protein